MRRLALALLASSALGLGFGQAVSAADIPLKARPAPVPVAVPYSWTGFYVGAHFGVGWGRKEWTGSGCDTFDGFSLCGPTKRGSHTATGPLGGVQTGFNWQTGYAVFGIEGQYSWANLKGDHQDTFSGVLPDPNVPGPAIFTRSDRFATTIKGIATIAGRIGLTSWPNDRTLFYVKAGAAYVNEDYTQSLNASIDRACNGCDTVANGQLSASHSRWGWMAGIGVEYGLFDNWSAKVEYNYLDFGNESVTLVGSACASTRRTICGALSHALEVRQEIHLIKFGLNYRFGGKAPVVAKY
jgi:outer membrane immunogenic protein